MLKHYKALSLCAAAALTGLSVIAVTPAQAKSDPVVITGQRIGDLPTRRVGFADLNLASAAGQRTLERRVGFAVKQVCFAGGHAIDQTVESYANFRGCSDFAWDGARPQIAAAVDRARALALNGNGAVAVGSVAITISAPAGA